jgi:hypothetical protein
VTTRQPTLITPILVVLLVFERFVIEDIATPA